jgi:hypothetical protein
MTYQEKPDYARCVAIVASSSLWEMIKPGALAVISPIFIGVSFKILGQYRLLRKMKKMHPKFHAHDFIDCFFLRDTLGSDKDGDDLD